MGVANAACTARGGSRHLTHTGRPEVWWAGHQTRHRMLRNRDPAGYAGPCCRGDCCYDPRCDCCLSAVYRLRRWVGRIRGGAHTGMARRGVGTQERGGRGCGVVAPRLVLVQEKVCRAHTQCEVTDVWKVRPAQAVRSPGSPEGLKQRPWAGTERQELGPKAESVPHTVEHQPPLLVARCQCQCDRSQPLSVVSGASH